MVTKWSKNLHMSFIWHLTYIDNQMTRQSLHKSETLIRGDDKTRSYMTNTPNQFTMLTSSGDCTSFYMMTPVHWCKSTCSIAASKSCNRFLFLSLVISTWCGTSPWLRFREKTFLIPGSTSVSCSMNRLIHTGAMVW